MPDELQRLVIQDFKGYLPGRFRQLDNPLPHAETAHNMLLDKYLEPALGFSLDQTPFSTFIRLLLPFKSSSFERLIMSDGTDWKYTTGNGSSQYFGYTTGTVTRSGTALTGTSTDWDGNIEAGDQFKYDADSTWLNIATVNSDTSITLSTSAGATSGAYTIRKIMVGTTIPSGVVFDNKAILSDNDRIHDSYDGTSLVVIANMPVVKGLVVHKRHVFGWTDTNIYWADINAPTTWTVTNTESVFKNDGGKIIRCVSYANSLVVVKDNGNFYLFVGEAPFDATNATYSILKVDSTAYLGTLCPYTFVVYQGLLWFLTSYGVYTFDGVVIQRIESPINTEDGNYKFAPVCPTGVGGETTQQFVDTAFSSGTLSDVEINSVDDLQLTLLKSFSGTSWTEDDGASNLTEDDDTVTFADAGTTGGTGRVYMSSTNAYGSWEFVATRTAIAQSGGQPIPNTESFVDIISSSSTYSSRNGYRVRLEGAGNSTQWRNINLQIITSGVETNLISYTTLTDSGVTIKVTRTSAGLFELFVNGTSVGTATDTTYTASTHLWCTFDATGFYSGTVTLVIDNLKKTALSGTFISRVLDGTTSISSWLNIFYDETLNTQTLTLAYRAEASNPPTGSFTTVAEGVDTGATNRYFQYRLTFTSTNGLSPTVASVEVNYTITNVSAQLPCAWIKDDELRIACTQNSINLSGYSDINGGTIIYDGDVWRFQHIPVFTVIRFKSAFYGADSASGKLFLLDNTYQANNTNLVRTWTTGTLDFDLPDIAKDFVRIEVHAVSGSSGTITLTFTSDMQQAAGGTQTITENLNTAGSIYHTTVLLDATGKTTTISLSSTGSNTFVIRKLVLYWKIHELR